MTNDQIANVLAKALSKADFQELRSSRGLLRRRFS